MSIDECSMDIVTVTSMDTWRERERERESECVCCVCGRGDT